MYKKNRVVLVYPAYPGERQAPDRPPLGLLTVAAPLLERGFEVCFIDERAEKENNFDALLYEELKKNPICVGISSMSGRHIIGALRISQLVKEYSNIPVIWGGVHPSLEPESTLRHRLVDIIVRDDGEEVFPSLVAALKDSKNNLCNLRGIGFKDKGNIVLTEPSKPAQIENLPQIPFYLVDFAKYESRDPWTQKEKIIPMETSRGCPFSCSFCTESVRKKKWRALSPQRVISDIKQYNKKYAIRNFTFIDDNLFGDVMRGRRMVELIASENLGIRWYTNIRTDYMVSEKQEFIKLMEQSGCCMLTFGAESGSEKILDMINKRANKQHVIKSNRKLRDTNIQPHYVSIRGFPTETCRDAAGTLLLNIQLLLENKKAVCDLPYLIVTPGTIIARQCLKDAAGKFSLEDWGKIFDFKIFEKQYPWVSKETYNFIKRTSIITYILQRVNRRDTPYLYNIIYRILLRFFKVILRAF